ncbi:MAG TPA: hypothetical protein VKE94_11655, partial [Gemmataceae bacterium]|nr:hypothetical protein [Gemmataceae bacterium]
GQAKGTISPWVVAALSLVPAFLLALPVAFVGRIIGMSKASQILSESPPESGAGGSFVPQYSSGSSSARTELQTDRLLRPVSRAAPSASAGPSPRARAGGSGLGTFLLRAVAGVVWLAVFFVLGSFAITTIVMTTNGDDPDARRTAVEAASKASGVPLFFGSIALVAVLGKLGLLPGLRRRKAQTSTSEPALPPSGSSDSRLIARR